MYEHNEIERKYLIRHPNTQALIEHPGCEIWNIHQTYLKAIRGNVRRLRKVECAGKTTYFLTEKRNITDLACRELEREIAPNEYSMMMDEADPDRNEIIKTRYRIAHEGQVCEIDIYPFWQKQAIMEVELDTEGELVHIPDWVCVLREVTGNPMYRNSALAKHIPEED